ncbi:hypothetical protein HNP37_000041 [Flavobacterium nitrogenifigens]|uniref:Uncharacterized protein n=2 Tax=Flavobacterium TaxID=237 RepID=A0A7W7IT02_9FLAO|nr:MULTISPECIES: hypothetical protein [Flavobacterium]MBB4800002.1 hypothetical protein [Flavobacterium nitrogenifigens]MBB6386248.1 hypothetical protein [Flavobacterium notoginsengisoli]
MKNIFILLITFYCCLIYAQKDTNKTLTARDSFDVINQYLNSQIKDKTSEIIVISEKLNPNITLKFFEGQFPRPENEKADYNELYGGATRPLFNDRAYKIMKNKFYDSKKYILPDITDRQWTKTDLEFDKIKFISYVRFVSNSNNADDVEINNLPNFLPVFGISEPIIYDKKYLVFQFHAARTPFFGFSNSKVVVMKKTKNKWIVVQEIPSYELH